jgi:hypothetical protein
MVSYVVAATVAAGTYNVAIRERSVGVLFLSAAFVLVGSLLGKLTGVLIAVIRLAALRRRLVARVAVGKASDRATQLAPKGA